MALPSNGTPWPPKPLQKIQSHMRGWNAWYVGDTVRLAEHYGYLSPGVAGYPVPHQSQYRGGVIGGIARWFWGEPVNGQQLSKLHVPIAADLCQATADLIYAEPPTFTIEDDTTTQDRLNELTDDTLHGVLAEGAEVGGALGGHYLRVAWDIAVEPDKPFLTVQSYDGAWPVFQWGRLKSVLFWRRVYTEGRTVWRHLESHELDASGNGVIINGLYQGGETDLGRTVPLTEATATAPLAELVSDGGVISTESPGLDVVHVPNQRPQRRWREDPIGCDLGRSTLDGVEHFMDALDETYSSWMRDIRHGKSRIFAGKAMLDVHRPGYGASFDAEREVFYEVNAIPGETATGLPIQAEQFKIRVDEHKATADALTEVILRTAGFSSQTFGMDNEAAKASNMTATEVQSRERRSYMTRDRQIRLFNPQVQTIIEKLLAVDKAIFHSDVTPQRPTVTFADSVQESQLTLAQTATALRTAEAASTKTLVTMLHPDWPDDQINEEVAAIGNDRAPVPDPMAMGGGDPAGSGQFGQ